MKEKIKEIINNQSEMIDFHEALGIKTNLCIRKNKEEKEEEILSREH
jgi:hypothetical protein